MTNELQRKAEARKTKHVPKQGSEVWRDPGKSPADAKDFTALRQTVSALYMGMKDLHVWLHELEVFVSGGDIHTTEQLMSEMRMMRGEVNELRKALEDALREVEEEPENG